jgi:hypothetical protein
MAVRILRMLRRSQHLFEDFPVRLIIRDGCVRKTQSGRYSLSMIQAWEKG